MSGKFWTFPVPHSDALVVAPRDWEGLLLLNPPAAAVWRETGEPNLDQFRPAPDPPLPQSPRFETLPIETNCLVDGTTFRFRFANVEIADEISPRLAALPLSNAPPTHTFSLCETPSGIAIFRDDVCLGFEPLAAGARIILLPEIARLAVPDRDFIAILHGGAAGTRESCVIVAGASFSGKSTLCVALMQAGLLCYSDDSACLTFDFKIVGMPFAVSLRESSWPLFPNLDRPRFLPSNLNGTSPAVRPAAMIFVNYQPDAPTTLEPVATFDALVGLQQSGFGVEHTEPAIHAFVDWISHLPIYELTYSSLPEAVAVVRNLL